jgi:hypothetical protein
VRRRGASESLINAFVEQDAHLGAREQEAFGLFERGEGRFPRNGRKTFQKFFERFSTLYVVEQSLDGHPGAAEDGSSAEDVWILSNDFHEGIVSS